MISETIKCGSRDEVIRIDYFDTFFNWYMIDSTGNTVFFHGCVKYIERQYPKMSFLENRQHALEMIQDRLTELFIEPIVEARNDSQFWSRASDINTDETVEKKWENI